MTHHHLKTVQPYFGDVKAGNKTFELRKNDRDFKVGDIVTLREYVLGLPGGMSMSEVGHYTGETIDLVITYVLPEAFDVSEISILLKGWCIFGFHRLDVPLDGTVAQSETLDEYVPYNPDDVPDGAPV